MNTTQPSIDLSAVQRQLAPAQDFIFYHLFLPIAAFMLLVGLVIAIVRIRFGNPRFRR